jgi:hypothetical protein
MKTQWCVVWEWAVPDTTRAHVVCASRKEAEEVRDGMVLGASMHRIAFRLVPTISRCNL